MSILNNVFGHTKYTHSLFRNQSQDALNEKLARDNKTYVKSIKLDSAVKFVSKGVTYQGILKRRNIYSAKVLVLEPPSTQYTGKTVTVPYLLFVIDK
jgi:hypothetical protein